MSAWLVASIIALPIPETTQDAQVSHYCDMGPVTMKLPAPFSNTTLIIVVQPQKTFSPRQLPMLVLPVSAGPRRMQWQCQHAHFTIFAGIAVVLTSCSSWFDCRISSTGSFFLTRHQ